MFKKLRLPILFLYFPLFLFCGCEKKPTTPATPLVPDTTPPSANITSPSNLDTIQDTVLITVSATDSVGVSKVEFYMDTQLFFTDSSNPFSFNWSTLIYQDSTNHSIFAVAYDAANNRDTTQIISVLVRVKKGLLFIGQLATAVSAYSVFASGEYAFVAEQSNGVQILNIKNPANPTPISIFNTQTYTNGVFVDRNLIYLALYLADGNNGLKVLDARNPTTPVLLGQNTPQGDAHEVFVSGHYAYVAAKGAGMYIINVENPNTPSFVSYFATSFAWGVKVVGPWAYVTDGSSGLKILDVSIPASPTQVGVFSPAGDIYYRSFISGSPAPTLAYVAALGSGIFIIDVTNPATPSQASAYSLGLGLANGIFVNGNSAYVAYGDEGLLILDVSNPLAPTFIDSFKTAGNSYNDVFYSSGFIYVASNSGLLVFRYNP